MVLHVLLVLFFLVLTVSAIVISSVYVVRQQSVTIIEHFGKCAEIGRASCRERV